MSKAYKKSVRRFGSAIPFIDDEGKKFNLCHKADFDPGTVKSDGKGNIHEMPVLRKKPCFGRPEAHIRRSLDVRPFRRSDGTEVAKESHCGRCERQSPGVYAACKQISFERVESNPAIERALHLWFDTLEAQGGRGRDFAGRSALVWDRFLTAIRIHGGWTNINDQQVIAAEHQLGEDRKKRKNEQRREQRRRERERRRQPFDAPSGQEQTEFSAKLDDAAAERLVLLHQFRAVKDAPRWITKLDDEGCRLTVEVWKAQQKFMRLNQKITGKSIAEYLLANGSAEGKLESLSTKACKIFDRIRKLESTQHGTPFWPPFTR